jgi:hypothetical protein
LRWAGRLGGQEGAERERSAGVLRPCLALWRGKASTAILTGFLALVKGALPTVRYRTVPSALARPVLGAGVAGQRREGETGW